MTTATNNQLPFDLDRPYVFKAFNKKKDCYMKIIIVFTKITKSYIYYHYTQIQLDNLEECDRWVSGMDSGDAELYNHPTITSKSKYKFVFSEGLYLPFTTPICNLVGASNCITGAKLP